MARAKPLGQMLPDIRAGLALSTEIAARNITMDLKARGPYWTGEFEESWVVQPGQVQIESSKPETSTWEQIKAGPAARKVTPVVVSPADETVLAGYTIGNEIEYADIAMDLIPGDDDRYRGERPRATAELDWFEKYTRGGAMQATLGKAVKQGMGFAGFTR